MVAAGKAGVEAWPGFVWDDLEDVVRSQEQKSGWWVGLLVIRKPLGSGTGADGNAC